VEVVRTETAGVPAAIVAAVDAGGFVGELNLLDRAEMFTLLCRVREGAGTVCRVVAGAPCGSSWPTTSNCPTIVFKALIARPGAAAAQHRRPRRMEIVGRRAGSAAALALGGTYAARQRPDPPVVSTPTPPRAGR